MHQLNTNHSLREKKGPRWAGQRGLLLGNKAYNPLQISLRMCRVSEALRNFRNGSLSPFQCLTNLYYLMEANMFLTAKLNLISGMVIGAAAMLAMKQMCKQRSNRKEVSVPADAPQQ